MGLLVAGVDAVIAAAYALIAVSLGRAAAAATGSGRRLRTTAATVVGTAALGLVVHGVAVAAADPGTGYTWPLAAWQGVAAAVVVGTVLGGGLRRHDEPTAAAPAVDSPETLDLREREQAFRTIADNVPETGVAVLDDVGTVQLVTGALDPEVWRAAGARSLEPGTTLTSPPSGAAQAIVDTAVTGRGRATVRENGILADVDASRVPWGDGTAVLVAVRDRTGRAAAAASTAAATAPVTGAASANGRDAVDGPAHQRFEGAWRSAPTGMVQCHADGRVLEANPAMAELLDVPAEALRGANLADLLDLDAAGISMADLLAGEDPSVELRVTGVDDVWVSPSAGAVDGAGVDDPGFIVALQDVTERRRVEAHLEELALTDPLTGLANRTLLMDRVRHAWAIANRRHSPLGFVYIDLDHFKVVNDSLGHGAGDDLLVAVAERLRDLARDADTVARLGGDEFCILMEGLPDERDVAHRIAGALAERVVDAFQEPFMVSGQHMRVGVSAGVVVMDPTDVEPTPESLIRDADTAMYRAKADGRGRWVMFSADLRAQAVARHEVEQGLRTAVADGQLSLHFQPQFRLSDGVLVSLEALLRWDHPVLGSVPPGRFLGVATEAGLMGPIGAFVLERTAVHLERWTTRRPGLRASVNMTAQQLCEPEVLEVARAVQRRTLLEPGQLVVEVSEADVLDHSGAAARNLARFAELGFGISIDDFGTGHSSLSALVSFPVDEIKIDRRFVRSSSDDPMATSIVELTTMLGRRLGARVVAEGVEDRELLAPLRRHGIDEVQGYAMATAVPLEAVAALVADDDLRAPVRI